MPSFRARTPSWKTSIPHPFLRGYLILYVESPRHKVRYPQKRGEYKALGTCSYAELGSLPIGVILGLYGGCMGIMVKENGRYYNRLFRV